MCKEASWPVFLTGFPLTLRHQLPPPPRVALRQTSNHKHLDLLWDEVELQSLDLTHQL